MTLLPPRLNSQQIGHARKAGFRLTVRDAGPMQQRSIFGSMYSWFASNLSNPLRTYWPVGQRAKPPVNRANSDSDQQVSPTTALNLATVWSCVWLNARTLATLPLDLKRYLPSGKGELMIDDPLYTVLRWKPNSKMTACNFWTFMWASVQLWGAGYAEKKMVGGKVISLEPLLPEWVTTYLTDAGALRYRYEDPQNPRDFSADQVFRLMDKTLDGITGMSVIEFGRNSMGQAQASEQAAGNTWRNGLQAGGYIKVDKFLKKEQREQFREEINAFTGSTGKKRGGVMVLEGGVDFSALTIKPLDAELLSSRQFSVEELCRWFGVPPILIGHAGAGQTMWGTGVEAIFSGWARLSLRPYLTVCQQEVRASLTPAADRRDVLAEYDLDELLAADSQARATLYSNLVQNGIATRNECREKEGLPRMEGGDVLTVQSNLIPLERMSETDDVSEFSSAAEQVRNALRNFLEVSKS